MATKKTNAATQAAVTGPAEAADEVQPVAAAPEAVADSAPEAAAPATPTEAPAPVAAPVARPVESINARLSAGRNGALDRELRPLLEAMLADNAALAEAVNKLLKGGDKVTLRVGK